MRRLAGAALAFGGLLILAGVVCAILAIWTVGPDADRWGETGLVAGMVGLTVAFLAGLWLDVDGSKS